MKSILSNKLNFKKNPYVTSKQETFHLNNVSQNVLQRSME